MNTAGYVAKFQRHKRNEAGNLLFWTHREGRPPCMEDADRLPIVSVNDKGEAQVLNKRGKLVTLTAYARAEDLTLDEVVPERPEVTAYTVSDY